MDVSSLGALALNASLRTQQSLAKVTTQLSSGLRINSAADDPSGLAIAESLASRVAGIDQGVHEIQNASNALTVADGAMNSISEILQRMRSLVVEARSSLMSASDQADTQAELDQLRMEIDHIAQNTSFNGRALLDGSASSVLAQSSRVLIENSELSSGGELIDQTVDPDSPYLPANAPQFVNLVSVDSYDPVADVLNMTVTIGSQDPTFGPEQTVSGAGPERHEHPTGMLPPSPGTPTFLQNSQNGTGPQVLAFNIGTLTPARRRQDRTDHLASGADQGAAAARCRSTAATPKAR